MRSAGCLCALIFALCLFVDATVEAANGTRFEPPDGRIYSAASTSGIDANHDAFLATANQPSVAIYNRFGGKGLTDFRWVLKEFDRRDVAGMVSWYNFRADYAPEQPGGSSASIARGDVDQHILDRAADVRGYGEPLFLRMNWEMNGYWFAYSAYDKQGNLRQGNAHAHYRNAWRRTVELFRGGSRAAIDKRLAAIGLPGLTAETSYVSPTTNVSWVWNPSHGTQWPDRQVVHDYYPGDDYVDWVGVDWYPYGPGDTVELFASKARAPQGPNEMYETYSGPSSSGRKPFIVGEWGVRDFDRPIWTQAMFDWIAARPKVKAQAYFNYNAHDGNSQLQDFPAAAQVFRASLATSKWLRNGSDVRDYGDQDAPSGAGDGPPHATTPPESAESPVAEPPSIDSPSHLRQPIVEPDRGGGRPEQPQEEQAREPRGDVPKVPRSRARLSNRVLSLVAPAAGSVLTRDTLVRPEVVDPAGVKSVKFYLNGVLRDVDRPGRAAWRIRVARERLGRHSLRITSTNSQGAMSSVVVPFRIKRSGGTRRPSVSLGYPYPDQAVSRGMHRLRPRVEGATRSGRVRFYLDGRLQDADAAGDGDWVLDTRQLRSGRHTIRLELIDRGRRRSVVTRRITVPRHEERAPTSADAVDGTAPRTLVDVRTRGRGDLRVNARFAPRKELAGSRVRLYVNGRLEATTRPRRGVLSWNGRTARRGRSDVKLEFVAPGRPGETTVVRTSAIARE